MLLLFMPRVSLVCSSLSAWQCTTKSFQPDRRQRLNIMVWVALSLACAGLEGFSYTAGAWTQPLLFR